MQTRTHAAARAGRAVADPKHQVSGKMWVNVLREVPLFSGVSDRHLRKIAGVGTVRRYVPGAPLIRSGADGDACYIVLDGTAEVRVAGSPGIPIGIGSVVGEMALLDDSPRSADVIAETELVCFRLARVPFQKLLRSEPTVAVALLKTLAGRVRELQAANL